MPASRSPSRSAERKQPPPARGSRILIGLIAVLAVLLVSAAVVAILPASLIARFLPAAVRAEDFSGTLLHGAAGRITINARDAGAVEWTVHPLALLRLTLVADIHWVKVGFVIDGTAEVDTRRFTAHDIHGGGPIDSLHDLGVAAGWRGTATLTSAAVQGDFKTLESASGKLEVADLSSAAVAQGEDLGGYVLDLPQGAVGPDGTLSATLNDTGGPLEVQAQIKFSPREHTGMLSGTLKERDDVAPALRSQLDSLTQLHRPDASGRFPVDLEFTL